jgi:5'-nucleotidase
MAIAILHTNDTHGTLGAEALQKLRELRVSADLYFDTGDAIKTGNLGIPMRREPVWPMLKELNCTAGVMGNRESHVLDSAFRAKIAGLGHPLLAANMKRRDGSSPLPGSLELTVKGIKVGIFGVMVPMVTARMKTQAASAFLWEPPLDVAQQMVSQLRASCDLLIALTHIGHREDRKMAEQVPGIDLIFGGHSHTVLELPERINNTWICQGGSHSRFAGVYCWDSGSLTGGLVGLRPN